MIIECCCIAVPLWGYKNSCFLCWVMGERSTEQKRASGNPSSGVGLLTCGRPGMANLVNTSDIVTSVVLPLLHLKHVLAVRPKRGCSASPETQAIHSWEGTRVVLLTMRLQCSGADMWQWLTNPTKPEKGGSEGEKNKGWALFFWDACYPHNFDWKHTFTRITCQFSQNTSPRPIPSTDSISRASIQAIRRRGRLDLPWLCGSSSIRTMKVTVPSLVEMPWTVQGRKL